MKDSSPGHIHAGEATGTFRNSRFSRSIEALDEAATELRHLGEGVRLAALAHSVLTQLNVLSNQKYVSPYDVAMVYVALRENDQAFLSLEKALEQRSLWVGYLNVEPQLDSVRSEPRFQDLVRRIGLTPLDFTGTDALI